MSIQTAGFSYKGSFYLRKWSGETLSKNMIGPLDSDNFSVKVTSNKEQRKSYKDDTTYMKNIGSSSYTGASELSFSINGAESEMLAMLFGGDVIDLSIASGTVTGESITLPHDIPVKVDQEHISAVAITGAVEGTDFVVDAKLGAIKSLSTGGLTDNVSTTVNYSHGQVTGKQIRAGTVADQKVEVLGMMTNRETGEKGKLWVPRTSIVSEADLNLLSQTFDSAQFTGEAEIVGANVSDAYFNNQLLYT